MADNSTPPKAPPDGDIIQIIPPPPQRIEINDPLEQGSENTPDVSSIGFLLQQTALQQAVNIREANPYVLPASTQDPPDISSNFWGFIENAVSSLVNGIKNMILKIFGSSGIFGRWGGTVLLGMLAVGIFLLVKSLMHQNPAPPLSAQAGSTAQTTAHLQQLDGALNQSSTILIASGVNPNTVQQQRNLTELNYGTQIVESGRTILPLATDSFRNFIVTRPGVPSDYRSIAQIKVSPYLASLLGADSPRDIAQNSAVIHDAQVQDIQK